MNRKTTKTIITGPATRLPSQRGSFALTPPPPDPSTPAPRRRPPIHGSSVRVTNPAFTTKADVQSD